MILFADSASQARLPLNWAIVLPVLTGFLAVFFGLPRPRGRNRFLGALFGALALGGAALYVATRVGPSSADVIETVIFAAMALGAVVYAGLMVTQRNPARSAISFSLVVLHVCGLFLLNAAPFLMAATIIIYAGAIIVMFLFVLMLSHQEGYSDENDRTREPFMASLTGFALLSIMFVGLERVFDRAPVDRAVADASALADAPSPEDVWKTVDRRNPRGFEDRIDRALVRLGFPASDDPAAVDRMAAFGREVGGRIKAVRDNTEMLLQAIPSPDLPSAEVLQPELDEVKLHAGKLRDDLKFLAAVRDGGRPAFAGVVELSPYSVAKPAVASVSPNRLPAENVRALGRSLFTDHLLSIELGGTLLLVATIGTIAIAGRRGGRAA